MSAITDPLELEDRIGAPPFEDGMRLTREEFHRLWDLHPEIKHAERIDGVVVMPAARRHVEHGKPHSRLNHWLSHYEVATEGVEGSLAASVAIDPGNDPEPDSILFILSEAGGRCVIRGDMRRVLDVLGQGLATPEHAAFVERLRGIRE